MSKKRALFIRIVAIVCAALIVGSVVVTAFLVQ